MPAQPFQDASVWVRADLPATPRAWVHRLDVAQLAEIDAAIRKVEASGLPFERIAPEDFPLPLTAPLLAAARADLETGRGFSVLAGLPVRSYTYAQNVLACAGLSAHIGRITDQSYSGKMLVDVKDQGTGYSPSSRGFNSAAKLLFHTDGACLTGLLALGEAAEGGRSVLVSAGAVHNQILAERPDLYEVLCRGFQHHRRGEHAPGDNPVSPPIPVFSWKNGLMHCLYDRNQSLWAQEAGVVMTQAQLDALDCMDAVMAREENQLHMDLQLGDFQFVNNFSVLHARGEFRDTPEKTRHLLRIWLDAPGSRWQGMTTRELYVRSPALTADATS